ncbi:MAG: NnrU family protein [Gammaproteobacteria bacterium]|nr:NnrU family protein [Gammaproteobacteria bacterium]
MTMLVLGLILFLGSHSISIVNESWRDRMVARLGLLPFKVIYGLISLAGLVLIVKGYGAARMDPLWLWQPPAFLRHLAMLLMLPVFPALLAAYLPGRISRTLKHPMLVAVKAWALAHLLVNGALADVLLFGGFLAWAVADRISMKHRQMRSIPQAPARPINDVIAIVGGLALYLAFVFWLHRHLFGVAIAG